MNNNLLPKSYLEARANMSNRQQIFRLGSTALLAFGLIGCGSAVSNRNTSSAPQTLPNTGIVTVTPEIPKGAPPLPKGDHIEYVQSETGVDQDKDYLHNGTFTLRRLMQNAMLYVKCIVFDKRFNPRPSSTDGLWYRVDYPKGPNGETPTYVPTNTEYNQFPYPPNAEEKDLAYDPAVPQCPPEPGIPYDPMPTDPRNPHNLTPPPTANNKVINFTLYADGHNTRTDKLVA